MNAIQEELQNINIKKEIPEIEFGDKIDVDLIVNFINIFSQEENIKVEEVIECFHALEEIDKKAILERIDDKQKFLDTKSQEIQN